MLLIEDIFLIGFFPLVTGVFAAVLLKKRTFGIMFWSCFYIYIIIVLGLTLFPLPYQEVESMYPVPNNLSRFKVLALCFNEAYPILHWCKLRKYDDCNAIWSISLYLKF